MILLRIFVNLYFKSQRYMLYPLALLRRHAFTLVMLAGVVYVFTLFTENDTPKTVQYKRGAGAVAEPPTNQSAHTATTTSTSTPAAPKIPQNVKIDFVKKVEDGNSIFNSDLLDAMTKEEILNYSQVFYWAMDNLADGTAHDWSFYNTHGSITPLSSFENSRGQSCRRYKESLKVHEIQQNITGVACPQPEGGWCKLRNNSTPICGLGRKPGIGSWWQDVQFSIENLFR